MDGHGTYRRDTIFATAHAVQQRFGHQQKSDGQHFFGLFLVAERWKSWATSRAKATRAMVVIN
jgi:hypothetical protein